MKVILTKDVKNVGRAHDTVLTADGYALNFLIPKKLAIPATIVALQEAQMRRRQAVDRSLLDVALVAQNIATLAETRIVIKVKANERGHLYDGVDEFDILKAVKEQARIDLPIGAIRLEKPCKKLGVFAVPVSVGEVFGKFSITIEAES
ncbi:50S ribosomal protein L9 [Candidatus Kaiserbacteria bacterium RIFCSPLOWO2_01_FULL_55_19]|uniref:Large ribosomal subunit protein bL9 n=1 Tax=Candidatus Kaiserbacteria bacterium RIFCSPLOWO2_01_FULL_55_19 TaxID=1798516 RepID=A0A1F6ERT0_9BACT|nr:MAG: 50S ribosomal protein L9 [Candidatus Kaiserbacteria bacterium RIFCSPLOWO2_01_FULL_55_19]